VGYQLAFADIEGQTHLVADLYNALNVFSNLALWTSEGQIIKVALSQF